MALFKLNVYGENDKIIKSYETSRIRYGLIEDFISLSKKLDGKSEIEQFQLMKPILKTLFVGITDEELRDVDFREVTDVILSMFKTVNSGFGSDEKN